VLVWCRVLQHYSTQREIGVLIIMIINMITDMKTWILLSIIFLLAFCVTFIGLTDEGASGIDTTIAGALWAMYGEFYVDYFRETSGVLGEGLLWIFAMISNVLLVNLLIAMMSETYERIKDRADVEWKFGRVSSVLEAVERTHAMPPPFSFPMMAIKFLRWAVIHKCAGLGQHAVTEVLDDEQSWRPGGHLHTLKRRREAIAKQTLQLYRRKEDETNEMSNDGRLRRIEKLVLDLLIFSEDSERELKFLRDEVSDGQKQSKGGGAQTQKL